MDINDLDLGDLRTTNEPRTLQLVHPATGVPLTSGGAPVIVFIRSPQSNEMRGFARSVQNQRLKTAQRLGRMQVTAEEIEEEALQRLALAISGWTNLRIGGKERIYSPEAAKELVRDFVWIRDQVDTFLRDDGNFLVGPTTH